MSSCEISVEILGPTRIFCEERQLDLGPKRQRAVFATLALRPNDPLSREELIKHVWGLQAPTTVISSVHTYIYRLRRALSACGSAIRIHSEGPRYCLGINTNQVDANRFHTHVERGRRLRSEGSLPASVREFDSALALWRGDALESLSTTTAEMERHRLEELRFSALESRAANLLGLGFDDQAIQALSLLVRQYPLREGLSDLLMTAYARAGRRAEALAEFQSLRQRLIDELGVEPSGDLQKRHLLILHGREPETHSSSGTSNLTTGSRTPRAKESVPVTRPSSSDGEVLPSQLPRGTPLFIGRVCETTHVARLIASRPEHESPVALLTGGPGTGKSALAIHTAHRLADRYPDGHLYIDLEGFSTAPEPMSSLQALQTLIRGLGGAGPLPSTLKEGVGLYRSMIAHRRMLILLDNAFSEEQVRPLLPGTASSLVMVTSRNRLKGLVTHDGAHRVSVDQMPSDDAQDLMRSLTKLQGANLSEACLASVKEACARFPGVMSIAAISLGSASQRFTEKHCAHSGKAGDLLDFLSTNTDQKSNLTSILSWSVRRLTPSAVPVLHALGCASDSQADLYELSAATGMDPYVTFKAINEVIDAHLAWRITSEHFGIHPVIGAFAARMHLPRIERLDGDHNGVSMLTERVSGL